MTWCFWLCSEVGTAEKSCGEAPGQGSGDGQTEGEPGRGRQGSPRVLLPQACRVPWDLPFIPARGLVRHGRCDKLVEFRKGKAGSALLDAGMAHNYLLPPGKQYDPNEQVHLK